jgi:hypothetical protein
MFLEVTLDPLSENAAASLARLVQPNAAGLAKVVKNRAS